VFDTGTALWEIAVRTSIVYAALIVGLRLTGKRQIGQMAPFDFVVILLIANAVQNAMVGPDTSLTAGLVAAAVLLVINATIARFRERIPVLRTLVEGQPAVLISGGHLVAEHIRHEGVDLLELEQAIREHGLAGLADVQLAVLEVDGTISIVPRSAPTIRTHRRFRHRRHDT
jgi:uncharacterized membrane protein YcaP (DUF421 family)